MKTELSIIGEATNIASNVTSMASYISANHDIRFEKKESRKVMFALNTLGMANELIDRWGLEGRDLARAEALKDIFVLSVREDIMRDLR